MVRHVGVVSGGEGGRGESRRGGGWGWRSTGAEAVLCLGRLQVDGHVGVVSGGEGRGGESKGATCQRRSGGPLQSPASLPSSVLWLKGYRYQPAYGPYLPFGAIFAGRPRSPVHSCVEPSSHLQVPPGNDMPPVIDLTEHLFRTV